jgi:hypothetical protein
MTKKLRTQINGKHNNISSADENKEKNITLERLFTNYKRTVRLFMHMEVVHVFERNSAVLKKLSSFV